MSVCSKSSQIPWCAIERRIRSPAVPSSIPNSKKVSNTYTPRPWLRNRSLINKILGGSGGVIPLFLARLLAGGSSKSATIYFKQIYYETWLLTKLSDSYIKRFETLAKVPIPQTLGSVTSTASMLARLAMVLVRQRLANRQPGSRANNL